MLLQITDARDHGVFIPHHAALADEGASLQPAAHGDSVSGQRHDLRKQPQATVPAAR